MFTTDRSTPKSARPYYARSSSAPKATAALVALLISSTLLGGMLSLFEMQGRGAYVALAALEPSTMQPPVAIQSRHVASI